MTVSDDIAFKIREKRSRLSLSKEDFGFLLGLKGRSELLIDAWESGNSKPSESVWLRIKNLAEEIPFRRNETAEPRFSFIDLFAGIGGFRLPFQELAGNCLFSSEWDRFSQRTYLANFGDRPSGDITKIPPSDIPSHDILLAGFPCQSFSQAGLKKGFLDTRGTMFFEIQKILAAKSPKAFLLENVKQLIGHNKGQTLKTILRVLKGEHIGDMPRDMILSDDARKALQVKLDYCVDFRVLRARDFGVPQNRERIYIVGFNREYFGNARIEDIFRWPTPIPKSVRSLGDILEESTTIDPKYTLSKRLWEGHRRRKKEHLARGNGFGYSLFNGESLYANTISARYYKDGSEILIDQSDLDKHPRKLTPRECARLQGFPDKFITDTVSDAQAYRQFGNSVAVPVVASIANEMMRSLGIESPGENLQRLEVHETTPQLVLRFASNQ
jgi:DNA (cytosine-5)-methyltransferase 1